MRWAIPLALAVVASAALGCAPQVAAGCSSDADCASRCERDDDHAFPGGMCTMSCSQNEDCPMGTLCIEYQGDGLCAAECSSMDQCKDFGAGYICKDREDVHKVKQLVCWGD